MRFSDQFPVISSGYRDYDISVLRDSVAMVLQKNVLFSGTIKENLRWGNENATDDEIVAACRMACADEFINEFPESKNAEIAEKYIAKCKKVIKD